MPFVDREEVVPVSRKLSNSQVDVMPVRKNTEDSEPQDALLAVLMNWVPTGLERSVSWMTL